MKTYDYDSLREDLIYQLTSVEFDAVKQSFEKIWQIELFNAYTFDHKTEYEDDYEQNITHMVNNLSNSDVLILCEFWGVDIDNFSN